MRTAWYVRITIDDEEGTPVSTNVYSYPDEASAREACLQACDVLEETDDCTAINGVAR